MIGSVGLVFGTIFGTNLSAYMPFFATGMITWTLISSTILEGCAVFTQSAGLIKSTITPLITHVYRMMARQLIVFTHNLSLVALVWLIFRWPINFSILLVIPGIIIVVVTLTGVVLTLGVLCTRFRDIQQIIGAALQLFFLLTPILWMPNSLRGKRPSSLWISTRFTISWTWFAGLSWAIRLRSSNCPWRQEQRWSLC